MSRFRSSWALATASMAVLRDDKELALLPVLSALSSLVVMAAFVGPILLTGQTEMADGSTEFSYGPAGIVLSFVAYLVLTYVTVFFNTALICAADERLRGGDPTLRSALRAASAHAGRILPWVVVSATVSMILRAIEERAGVVGRIVVGLVGLAWSLLTFLVLPVLVFEGVGVGDAIKRSVELFKRTWGENVIASAGIGLVGMVAVLAGLPVVVLCAMTGVGALVAVGVIAFVLWVGVVAVVTSALTGIFQTALYRFATDGTPPAAFAEVDLNGAFTPRRGGRRGFF